MASAAMGHFGMDPGKIVRWLGGEYIGGCCNVARILSTVQGHITKDNYAHMKRILIGSCPVELKFDKPLSNKLTMIKRGNLKSFNDNPKLVLKMVNKEERCRYLLPQSASYCRTSVTPSRH